MDDVSTPNDEGITALHNAICAGHYEIVKVLVEFGCDVNSPDSDGWFVLALHSVFFVLKSNFFIE